tara:strand:- start:808 stop:3030 length:2223 start_codon:yes stop_codon:yes gene_type:complete
MNIIELQDNLKDVSDNVLMREMQSPSGNMPQFLVLSELTRRRRMRDDYKRQQAANMPTVAEEVMTAAGAPQEGLTAIARNMAPNSSIAQNTGADMAVQREPTRMPQMMAEGGIMRLNQGSALSLGDLRALKEYRRQLDVDDPNTMTSIAAENPFNPMAQYSTAKFGNVDLMQIAAMLQRGANRDGLVANFGADAVREAESVLSDHSYLNIGQLPLGMGGQFGTISKRELRQRPIKSYRDPSQSTYLGGENISSVSKDLDDFLPDVSPAPDFDATDEDDILDAEENRLVQQEVAAANTPNQPMPSLSQIDPETNLDMSGALGVGSLGQNLADAINNQETLPNISTESMDEREAEIRSAFGPFITEQEITELANASFPNDPDIVPYNENRTDVETPLIPEPDRSIDRQINPEKYLDLDDFLAQDSIIPSDEPRFSYPATPPSGAYPNIALPSDLIGPEAMGGKRSLFNLFPKSTGTVTPEDITKAQTDENAMRSQEESFDQPDKGMIEQIIEANTTGGGQQNNPNILDTLDTGGEETAAPMMPTGTDSYGALESRIAKMLADREKAAESDKYLALAQAGLALMASDSPTLAGAIGEAGLVGIGQLREARSQYDKDVLELLSTQADIDSARADRNLELQELALERDELEQTRQAQEALSKYRMASLDPRNASISDLQAGLNYINGEIQTQATTVTYDEVSGEEIEKIDMTKVDPQLLIQKKSLEDSLLTRLRGTGADFDATGS